MLTKNVLAVDVVLHLKAGVLHCEIDGHLFDVHVRDVVAFDRLAVDFGNGADVGCAS